NVTTAIVPASGTPRINAARPTTIPLNAATSVTPRKYPWRDLIIPPVIVCPTGWGTPRCRSIQARIDGPSLSRKKRLRAARESPKTIEVTPWIPWITPVVKAEMIFGTSFSTPDFAVDAPDSFKSRSFSQPSALLAASVACLPITVPCDVIPPITTRTTRKARVATPRRTIAAAAARGNRWAVNNRTSGAMTVATIVAATTGPTIVCVVPSSQMIPTTKRNSPTRSHDVRPRSRNHRGGVKTLESWPASSGLSSTGGSTHFPARSRLKRCAKRSIPARRSVDRFQGSGRRASSGVGDVCAGLRSEDSFHPLSTTTADALGEKLAGGEPRLGTAVGANRRTVRPRRSPIHEQAGNRDPARVGGLDRLLCRPAAPRDRAHPVPPVRRALGCRSL